MMHSAYLSDIFDIKSFKTLIEIAKKELKHVDFDAIVVTGNSGTIFGGALAVAMDKELILVRKTSDKAHSTKLIEGKDDCKKYVFVDDHVDTGDTVRRVFDGIKQTKKLNDNGQGFGRPANFHNMKFMGIYSYRDCHYWTGEMSRGFTGAKTCLKALNHLKHGE